MRILALDSVCTQQYCTHKMHACTHAWPAICMRVCTFGMPRTPTCASDFAGTLAPPPISNRPVRGWHSVFIKEEFHTTEMLWMMVQSRNRLQLGAIRTLYSTHQFLKLTSSFLKARDLSEVLESEHTPLFKFKCKKRFEKNPLQPPPLASPRVGRVAWTSASAQSAGGNGREGVRCWQQRQGEESAGRSGIHYPIGPG